MSDPQASASYARDLGDGLVVRWSTTADIVPIAELTSRGFRRSEDEPPEPGAIWWVRRHMSGNSPIMGPGDFAVVVDTLKPGNPVVSCTCLQRMEWAYEGISFPVGRPESVVTDPAYRNRGLIRAVFEMVHARSAAEGHLVQAIIGIPYFYRQFGYEYALDLGGRPVVYTSLIPKPKEGAVDPYAFREATLADIPFIAEQYSRRCQGYSLWSAIPERNWRYRVGIWQDPFVDRADAASWPRERLLMVQDAAAQVCGLAVVAARRWGPDLAVYGLELVPEISLPSAMPPLLRALQTYGLELPTGKPDVEPLREISFNLGRSHPIYDVLGSALAPRQDPPYAWYVRVPDLPAFIRHIAPALERRLASSPAAGHTGELKLNFYRGGLGLAFEAGRLTQVEPWKAPIYGVGGDAGFPPLVFLQLLFGHRSLADLRYAFPDVWASSNAEVLLHSLFPARPSWVTGW